jgi:hypothetical protein
MTLVTTKLKSGGLHEKHVVALGKLGTTSAFAFRPRETNKTQGNLSLLVFECKIYFSRLCLMTAQLFLSDAVSLRN